MFPMKKTLIRAISFFLTLSLLTGLLSPFAGAIEYEGVESMTVDATAAFFQAQLIPAAAQAAA